MGFEVWGKFIPFYGFFIALGIVFASILLIYLCRKTQTDLNNCIIIAAIFIAAGFTSAKLLYLIVSADQIKWNVFFTDINYFNQVLSSGFVFYGGLIGALLVIPSLQKFKSIEFKVCLPVICPCVSLIHGFGRIGCAFAGCCYGKPAISNFHIMYQNSAVAPNGIPLIPIQLIEAFFLFIITAFLLAMVLNGKERLIAPFYIFSYSVLRFILEFFRGDIERGFLGTFSTSQIISLVLITVLLILWQIHRKHLKSISKHQ